MPSVSVSGDLQDLYESYDFGDLRWHRLAAQAKARNILEMSRSLEPSKTLDVGAGDGSVLQELEVLGFQSDLYAVEISEANIRALKAKNITNLKEVALFCGYSIPFPDRSFDLAIASHVLEHVEHERLFLCELARVAKWIFIEVPLENTIRLTSDFKMTSTGHLNFYSYNSVRRLLQTCKLKVLKQKIFDIPLEIVTFHNKPVGVAKFILRRGALLANATFASKIFTYHCGILCRTGQ